MASPNAKLASSNLIVLALSIPSHDVAPGG